MPETSHADHVHQQLARHSRRLMSLRSQGFTAADPEPLHQWRVACRRLRTALTQFAPLLELPRRVTPGRFARLARSAGHCRDLDVMLERLRLELLPQLPDGERRQLSPALLRLERRRAAALGEAQALLASRPCGNTLQQLETWLHRPRFTPLAAEPLQAWRAIWLAPVWAELFLLPGWWARPSDLEALHGLRRRLKASRYALEGLDNLLTPAELAWLQPFRQAQDQLGGIQDLVVLQTSLADRRLKLSTKRIPTLQALLRRDLERRLQGWQNQLHWWRAASTRQALIQDLTRQLQGG